MLAQTQPAAEIIIVDDGSTDGTGEILDKKYRNQLLQLEQSNSGVSSARNAGINQASGNWIALLDSDDEWLPNKLEQQLTQIKNHPECVLCHCDEIWIRKGIRVNPMNKHKKSGGDIYVQCLPLCAISPSSVVFKRSLLDIVGYFDEQLPACEDYDMWLKICAQYSVHYLDQQLLLKYGGHEDQLSKQYWGMDRFRIQSLQKILDAGVLPTNKRISTLAMLQQKVQILLNGAKKHQNESLINECQSVIKKYDLQCSNEESPKPESRGLPENE